MANGLAWNYIQPVSLGNAEVSTANIFNNAQKGVADSLGRFKQFADRIVAEDANRQKIDGINAFMNVLQNSRNTAVQTQALEDANQRLNTLITQQNTSIPAVKEGSGLVNAPIAAAQPYMNTFKQASQQYGVPLDVLLAVAQTESDFNPNAVSSTGVRGIMQVTGDTYKGLGFTGDRSDPNNSIQAGAKLLSQLYNKYGNWNDTFYAYNGGPNAVTGINTGDWGVWANNPSKIKEITNYASKVNRNRQGWARYNG